MEENNINWFILILVGVVIWSLFFHKDTYEGYTAEEWHDEYVHYVERTEELSDALEEANNNIDEVNDNIQSAKWYAWESYEEMGDALDSLDTVNTVPEP